MTCQISPSGFWNSTPIGRSIDLSLCQDETLSPQLILEDRVVRLPSYHSPIYFIGTLISDDESQRLTYVIDRYSLTNHHQLLTGEFLIPIQCDNNTSTLRNHWMQDGMKEIDLYCHSSEPIELHRFFYLCGQISSRHSSSSSIDLSFDLLSITNSFTLIPINPDSVHIVPTALWKNLSSSPGNHIYNNGPHFGYCSLDRMSNEKILLILENDPQACALPLLGIWVSGIIDVQCAYVWAVCLRYCLNSSLKQRLRSGINSHQSFLLACYSATSYGQCIFYEVCSTSSTSTSKVDYDRWKCSQQISVSDSSTQFPYDFQFQRVSNQSNNYPSVQIPATFSSPNTNGSLFGFPRIPPKPSAHSSPSWNLSGTSPIKTPNRSSRSSTASPKLKQGSSPTPMTVAVTDNGWKEEFIERMRVYELQIQSLTTLVTQLLTTQRDSSSSPIKQCTKRDIGIQSPPLSPYMDDQSLSTAKSNSHSSRTLRIEHDPSQTSVLHSNDGSMMSSVVHQEETMIDYSALHKSSSIPTDVNPVDILKPIFRFIDNQQQKQQQQQQQQGSASSLMTTYNSTDTSLLNENNEELDYQTENMFQVANTIQQQQQHVTSTTTTGISFISNGVQMQFINQQSSTTTVYPQSQPTPPLPPPSSLATELLPTSPPRSENSLSIEVHGLEMKYLEDEQLAVAIECDRKSQTPPVVDKSLSFGTQEYLQRYGLFTDSNAS